VCFTQNRKTGHRNLAEESISHTRNQPQQKQIRNRTNPKHEAKQC